MALKDYTIQIEVEPGEMLYEDKHLDRGLFFIEHGIMVRSHSCQGDCALFLLALTSAFRS
jgi:phage antirepressor YoqD-like protein